MAQTTSPPPAGTVQRCQTNAAYHPPAASAKRASEKLASQPTRHRSARKTAEHVNRTLAIHQPTRQQDRRTCEQVGSRASPALPGDNDRQPCKQDTSSPAIPAPPSMQDLRAHEQKVGSSAIPTLHGNNYRQPRKQGACRPAIPRRPARKTTKRASGMPTSPHSPQRPTKTTVKFASEVPIAPSLHLPFSFNIHFISPNVC